MLRPAVEPDERFEIQLSHICNNRCVFCVSGQMTELRRAAPTPLDDLKGRFDEAHARGIRKVTLLGGEPTIHATFFPILRYALDLGFETIVIFTNGARLDKSDFIDRVLALGKDRFEWRISIQGWTEASHDGTTKKPGSWARIVAGLERLTAEGQTISLNMCVVEQNYRSLAHLPDLIARYPIRQVHLDMVRPRDSGERTDDYLDGLLPDYPDLGAVMDQMFDRLEAEAPQLDVNVGNLPYCQLPRWAHRIHHGGAKTYTVSAEGRGQLSVVAWDKYEDKRSDKRKLESCESCAFERRCDGFVELYAERRGTDRFVPVSREKLRRIDPEQRMFVHQLDAGLVSLTRAAFAKRSGWLLRTADDDELERWARQTWVHREGGRVVLRFSPAQHPGGGDAEHRDFVVSVESYDGLDAAAAVELLEQVFEHLVREQGGDTRTPPSLERFEARRTSAAISEGSTLVVPAAPAVLRALERLTDSALAGELRPWVASARAGQGGSAQVAFSGPGRAVLTLRTDDSGARLSGSWAFEAGAEPVLRRLAVLVGRSVRPPDPTPTEVARSSASR
jgi:MoaA/NifB/PqqE/SkfB family radical SAM enzyme